MRFQRLDIVKYGKFSERSIELPVSKQDFHLIIGPNEAGKSTFRSAILDLLFGIPARSTHGFLHPLNELRLGASIVNPAGSLEFQRIKAQKQTLRSPLDAALSDAALVPFIGSIDRNFFDQMFGLDHTRLVQGGNSILNAENDIGQILFQSAAGIAGLGKIRDELVVEADKLWGPRRSSERAYYVAADQLEKATHSLKEMSVRTKVWSEANGKVESLLDTLEQERENRRAMEIKRTRLERVRRLAPLLQTLNQNERLLEELGETFDLPLDAAQTLAKAERDIATAEEILKLRNVEVQQATTSLGGIVVDEAALNAGPDIIDLDRRRIQYSAYDRDIERRKSEVEALFREVCDACNQLNWSAASEDVISGKLPSLLVRRRLGQLAREASGLTRALKAAEQAERSKASDIDSLAEQLKGVHVTEVKPMLRAALSRARLIGDTDMAVTRQRSLLSKAEATFERLSQSLGLWRRDAPELFKMQLPAPELATGRIQERRTLEAELKVASKALDDQTTAVTQVELTVSQFTETHHTTTLAAVSEARRERDASWESLKQDKTHFEDGAQQFEHAMRNADNVADTHLSNVEDATELQSRLHQLERERQTLATAEHQVLKAKEEIERFDVTWSEACSSFGLAGMSLDDMAEWLRKRDATLTAWEAREDAQKSLDSTLEAVTESTRALEDSLRESGIADVASESLAALCTQADGFISSVDGAAARRDTLTTQLNAAQAILAPLKLAVTEATEELDRWKADWTDTLTSAGLPPTSDVGTAEGALELIGLVEEKLRKIKQIRVERINAMNADLQTFAVDVMKQSSAIAPELQTNTPTEIVQQLVARLQEAHEANAERSRLKEALRNAESQATEAMQAKQQAEATVKPLMARTGGISHELLAQAIAKSDERRRLLTEANNATIALTAGGDGLTRQQIEAEIGSVDLAQLAADLAQLNDDLSGTIERQSSTSAEHATAQRVLAEIGGSDAAALAEAQRQEALAKMSEAAERYIKTFTAARLLRWSIDRYREEKQGPMLARAGAIFAMLTRGSFQRLVVDFERQPMTLEGQRPDGRLVGISGMSDGTRDQLYLALRLAALELHLEQATPLPFIADDLFVNYDDQRARAGLEALATLSEKTQVVFLSHHDHLTSIVREVFGNAVNVVHLDSQ
jgi:uncharacterized protein YhaN